MSLEATAGRIRVVIRDGRRFIVRAPTLATVLLASGLFPSEIAGFSKQAVKFPALLEDESPGRRGLLLEMIGDSSDGRIGELLETCVSAAGGFPGDVLSATVDSRELAADLALAVLSLCDIRRCFVEAGWEAIGKKSIEELEAPIANWFDPSARNLEILLYVAGKEFGKSPTEIAGWPFETLIMTAEIRSLLANPTARDIASSSTKDFPIDDPGLAAFGITYEKIPAAPASDDGEPEKVQ